MQSSLARSLSVCWIAPVSSVLLFNHSAVIQLVLNKGGEERESKRGKERVRLNGMSFFSEASL